MTDLNHVVIIGGGIGGLCLAQGLKQAGVHATVYERDRAITDRLQAIAFISARRAAAHCTTACRPRCSKPSSPPAVARRAPFAC